MSRTDVHVTPARSPLAVCAQLTQAIGRTESLDEIYEAALDALRDGLGVERASVLLFEPDGVMRFKAWRGLSDSYRRAVEGHTPWLPHAKCAEPIVVADVQQDAGLAAFLPTIRAENIAAMAFIPLEGVDGVLGKFMLYYGKPHHLSSEELQLASVIAAQIAFAVERTQAHQASRTSQERQKEAELARVEALEQSNRASQRLAAIVQSSDDAIVSKDLNGVIMSWNPAAERMFGYSESEAVGQSITLILPLDRRAEEDRVLRHIRAGEPVEMETVRQHRSGSRIDISLKVSPVKNADGRIVGASKIARDITARKRDDAERAELQRRLSLLVEASASLLNSPETESVRSATMSLARQLLVADGYAVWVNDPGQPGWRVAESEGVSDDFSNRVISSYRGGVAPRALSFSGPLAVTDVAAEPLLEEQLAAYRRRGDPVRARVPDAAWLRAGGHTRLLLPHASRLQRHRRADGSGAGEPRRGRPDHRRSVRGAARATAGGGIQAASCRVPRRRHDDPVALARLRAHARRGGAARRSGNRGLVRGRHGR